MENRIRELRKQKKMTMKQLGQIVGLAESTISQYETGKRQPDNETLLRLGEYFDVSVEYLLGMPSRIPTNSDILSQIATQAQTMLPIIGTIRAGYPIRAEEHIEGWELSTVKNPKDHFFLRVAGDSMIGAGITDGCLVLIHEQPFADDGQIVACIVDGEDATLKRFFQRGETITLLPENPSYKPIVLSVKDFEEGYARIVGVAKQVVRDL